MLKTMCFGIRKTFPNVVHIDTETLSKWIEEKESAQSSTLPTMARSFLLLDVREHDEYVISHLPNSIRVSPSANEDDLVRLLKDYITARELQAKQSLEVSVVCYCSLGYRSSDLCSKIVEILKNISFNTQIKVYNLEGSIFKWANEGRPLVDRDGRVTKYVHPYNTTFGLALSKDLRKYSDDLK